jgi:hypothetical protein
VHGYRPDEVRRLLQVRARMILLMTCTKSYGYFGVYLEFLTYAQTLLKYC